AHIMSFLEVSHEAIDAVCLSGAGWARIDPAEYSVRGGSLQRSLRVPYRQAGVLPRPGLARDCRARWQGHRNGWLGSDDPHGKAGGNYPVRWNILGECQGSRWTKDRNHQWYSDWQLCHVDHQRDWWSLRRQDGSGAPYLGWFRRLQRLTAALLAD